MKNASKENEVGSSEIRKSNDMLPTIDKDVEKQEKVGNNTYNIYNNIQQPKTTHNEEEEDEENPKKSCLRRLKDSVFFYFSRR